MKDLSIIIEGLEHPALDSIIANYRSFYPESEIILSSNKPFKFNYHGANAQIENINIGLEPLENDNNKNINFQLANSIHGLGAANRKFAMKVRSDMILTKKGLVEDYFEKIQKYNKFLSKDRIVTERIMCSSIYSVNPRSRLNLLYHPGDWFFLGLREDLLNYFSSSPWMTNGMCKNSQNQQWRRCEQYFLLNNFPQKRLKHCEETSTILIEDSEKIMANNFIVSNHGVANNGFENLKYRGINGHPEMLSFDLWKKLYERVIDEV